MIVFSDIIIVFSLLGLLIFGVLFIILPRPSYSDLLFPSILISYLGWGERGALINAVLWLIWKVFIYSAGLESVLIGWEKTIIGILAGVSMSFMITMRILYEKSKKSRKGQNKKD